MKLIRVNFGIIFLIFFQMNAEDVSLLPIDLSLSQVMDQYEQAFKDLLLTQPQPSSSSNQNVLSVPLILSTYQKLISPSVLWINGFARVVLSEVACKFPYYQDLQKLVLEYEKHAKVVQNIIELLPESAQAEATDIFYESLAEILLQTCFNIVQQITNQNSLNAVDITAAYQAYSLAWTVKTQNLNVMGVSSLVEFEQTLNSNMIALLTSAVNVAQTSLASHLSSGVHVEPVYAQLKQCYEYLYQVYTNSGDTTDAQTQQNLLLALETQKQNYVTAKSQQQQAAEALHASYVPDPIVLDVNNVAMTVQNISTSITSLTSAYTLYYTAIQSFSAANDLMGQTECATMYQRIGYHDMLLRSVQDLWGLYLTNQLPQSPGALGFDSFPSLQQFVMGQNTQTITSNNAVLSLQNLVGMCSSQYDDTNNIWTVFNSSAQTEWILPILQQVVDFAYENSNLTSQDDPLFHPQLIQNVEFVLQLLISMCNCMINGVNNSDQTQVAPAMTYAQLLDGLFAKNSNLNQYIPHLPDCLTGDQTWVNFAAQFFYQAQLATTAADAVTLAGTVTVTMPATLTAQQLATMQTNAANFIAQAETLEKTPNFAAASVAYEQALGLYQQFYSYEPTWADQVKILKLANLAKTRFVATNFAATVQSSGSATLGKISNIPTSYLATSYQLSFDPTMMGSSLPACLSAATPGQPLTTFAASDLSDLFALIKGYLVAQIMTGQGMIGTGGTTFNNYFSDYTMTTVVQSSGRANAAIKVISSYVNNFTGVGITSVTLQSANQVVIELTNFPLAAVNAPSTTLSSAANFYAAASTLFAPGTIAVTIGGQAYDPGNDQASQNIMLKNLGYAYLSAAQAQKLQFSNLIQQLSEELGITTTGATAKALPADFYATFTEIQNQAIAIQALLYGQQINTAYGCFVQAGATTLAQKVKQEFINLYKTQIDFAKNCLIGDPTSSQYLSIVSAINQAYVNWAAELDSATDAALIAQINAKIAALYEFAGQQCLNYSFSIPEFPKSANQIHYMVAGQYYYSAQQQYQKLDNPTKVQALANKLNQMYYQAAAQNIALYFDVKQYGAVYTSESTQTENPVSFEQLNSDFNEGSAGNAESTLYSTVQKLLLDAAMVFEFLGGSGSSGQTNSNTSAEPTVHPNHKVILQFLAAQNLINSTTVQQFSEIPLSATANILKLVQQPYASLEKSLHFNSKPLVFAAFNNLMFMMVNNMYNIDYQAVTATSTANQIGLATQNFLSSIQNETMKLESPSSAYVDGPS